MTTDLTKFLCRVFTGRCGLIPDAADPEPQTPQPLHHDDTLTAQTQEALTSSMTSSTQSAANNEDIEVTSPQEVTSSEIKEFGNHEPIEVSPITEDEIATNDTYEKELEQGVIHQILVACQAGDLDVFQSIHESHPQLVGNFNKSYVCSVSFDDMPLTLLQLSCVCGRQEIVLYILSQPQVDVNVIDPITRSTALHIAVCMEDPSTVHILCSYRETNVNLQNIDGKTAMQIAIERQLVEIVEIMLTAKHGEMNWYLSDLNKNNLFHVIAYNPDEAIVMVLAFAFSNLSRPIDEQHQSLQLLLEVSYSTISSL
jgi:hypothetical protein